MRLAEAHSESNAASKIKIFAKIINGSKFLTSWTKISILHV